MLPFKTMIVAHDGSKDADRALGRALALASGSARVDIVHVGSNPHELTRVRRRFEARLGLIASWSDAPRGAVIVEAGDPASVVARVAARAGAQLLVMGLHRKRGLVDQIGKTTSARMAATCGLPALIALKAPPTAYANILVGLDYEETAAAAVRVAAQWFPEAVVEAIHAFEMAHRRPVTGPVTVHDLDRAREDWMEEFCGRALDTNPTGVRLRIAGLHVRDGAPADVLSAAAKDFSSDLVVVGTHGRTGLARALLGSVAGRLLIDPPCDLLIVPADG